MRSSRRTTSYKKKNTRIPLPLIAGLCVIFVALNIAIAKTGSERIPFFSARKTQAERPEEQTVIAVYHENELLQIGLEDYLVGVTAAEMPASYDIEALKAQAAAARTYTLRKLGKSGCGRHAEADICTDSGHCQAYASEERLRERWKKDYNKNLTKIKEAVYGTAGEIVTYRGEPIDAMYHASSGGATENSEDVYKNEISYLRGVESPDAEGYEATVAYTHAEFAEKVNAKLGTDLHADSLADDLVILSHLGSGRVKSIRICEETFSGGKFRGAAGLPSAMFTFELTEDSIIFSVKGYGHGVGMSQSGANHYAKQGMDYRDILHHYYTDVDIEKIDDEQQDVVY